MSTDGPSSTAERRPDPDPRDTYGDFIPPHEREIPTEELSADYERLAKAAAENPDVTYYVRYEYRGRRRYGMLRDDAVEELDRHYFADPRPTGGTAGLDEVRLLAPLDPNRVSKVLGVALNTPGPDLTAIPHTSHPRWFVKLPTSITGPGGGVEVPEEAVQFIHEAELVLVIGRAGRHLSVEEAADHIWGVTAGNDMTEFAWFRGGPDRAVPPPLAGKMSDTLAPIGPAIAVGLDYSDLQITHRVNGTVTQRGSTGYRLQQPAELVAHLSRFVTLLPGDVIFSGATPFEPDADKVVRPGDEMVADVEGVGVLRNRAVRMGGTRWEHLRGPAPP